MPRRRFSRVSISSEHSTCSDHSENVNVSVELPDPGLPKAKTKAKDGKGKKVSCNFPVEVITKTGKFTGLGTISLLDSITTLEKSSKLKKTRKEIQEMLLHLESERRALEENNMRQEIQEVMTYLDGGPRALDEKTTRQEILEVMTHLNRERRALDEKKTRQEIQEVLTHLEGERQAPQEKQRTAPKGKGAAKAAKKPQTTIIDCINKKEVFKETKKTKGANKNETEDLKEILKKALVEEKAAQAEFEVMNKIYKPGECMKFVTVEIHPTLLEACYIRPAVRELEWLGARVVPAPGAREPGLLLWVRRVPPAIQTQAGGQVILTATKQICPRALYLLDADRLGALAGAAAHVAGVRAQAGTSLTLIVWGAGSFRERLPHGTGGDQLTQEKFTKMIADLQMELMVSYKIDIIMVESPMELAMLMIHYTRAVADAPYKKAKRDIDEQAEFYMRGDNRNCVTVDKEGNGLSRLWEQMIGILPKSSLEVARALGAEYKKPAALIQELQSENGVEKIADMGVNRTKVPGAKPRRIGPEFARKLHILFTTEDGNTVIE